MAEEKTNLNEEGFEEKDIDVTEFSMTEDEIDEWILKLDELKETKQSITLEIDDETELMIHYEEDKDDEGEDEENA